MTKRIRTAQALGALALVFVVEACGGGNNPAMSPAGTGNTSGTAGTTGGAGTTGTGGGGDDTGAAGSTGAGGSDSDAGAFGEPACLSTVSKGGACGPTDQQLCYKTCGPEKTGVKAETCTTAGTYSEMSGCTFDKTKDYSCYKIPTAANAECPADLTPKGSDDCGALNVPHCVLCNSLQGVTGGQYFDSNGSPKVGWCTCQEPNANGVRTWTCATDTSWPCPMGSGC